MFVLFYLISGVTSGISRVASEISGVTSEVSEIVNRVILNSIEKFHVMSWVSTLQRNKI